MHDRHIALKPLLIVESHITSWKFYRITYPLGDSVGRFSVPPPLLKTGLCVREPPRITVDLPVSTTGSPWGALLRTTVPLLAQEVFELVHQLLWVEVRITLGARRFITRRVIGLL